MKFIWHLFDKYQFFALIIFEVEYGGDSRKVTDFDPTQTVKEWAQLSPNPFN